MAAIKAFKDMYKNSSAFLIGGGPSLRSVDKNSLEQPGMLTMGVNNSASTIRPNLWACVDHPTIFIDSIWKDPSMIKFVPMGYGNAKINDSSVYDYPAVIKFRASKFNPDEFFSGQRIFHGGQTRSVLITAISILHFLGIRRIYLVGVDFKMEKGEQNYSFEQETSNHAIEGNNSLYKRVNDVFTEMIPEFQKNGLEVFNTNRDSGLTAFPYVDLEKAIADEKGKFPDISLEETAGRYEKSYDIARKRRANNTKTMDVKKQIVVNGISRSGTHAVSNWIASQLTGNVQYRNDLKRLMSTRYLFTPSAGNGPSNWYALPSLDHNKNTDSVDSILYSYENCPAEKFDFPHRINASEKSIKSVLLRDPFNLLATCYKHIQRGGRFWFWKNCTNRGEVTNESLLAFKEMWMSHASLIENDNDVVPILYNKWFSDEKYRDSLAMKLCLDERSDMALSQVPRNGRGSSFQNMKCDGNAQEMDVLGRWKEYRDEDWFRSFFANNSDMVDVSERLFGRIEGTETLWA